MVDAPLPQPVDLVDRIRRFFASQSAAGAVLALAVVAALIASNTTALSPLYQQFIDFPGELRLGGDRLVLAKPLQWWVNDLWMAVFFFLVGLHLKREMLDGELASLRQAALPAFAALGGMVVPALIYMALNHADIVARRGWGIPMATDIAFVLGVLQLLGPRVPASLKVFVTAVAIFDDLGAILVIAVFYTADLSVPALLAAGAGALLLGLLNRARVPGVGPYAIVGLGIWACMLKSGVHPTLAGVVTAMAIPLHDRDGSSPLFNAEHTLQPWVTFMVLPTFAFVNAGVELRGVTAGMLVQGVPIGILLGLVVGKPVGVFGASWLVMRMTGSGPPAQANLRQLLGASALCGIGFTMSLFIGGLAFAEQPASYAVEMKFGVLGASLLAGVLGAALLAAAGNAPRADAGRRA